MTQEDTFSASELLASMPAFAPSSAGSPKGGSDDGPGDALAVWVVGNLLVAFAADVDRDHQLELLYVMGLAQLNAVRNHGKDPRTDPVGFSQDVTETIRRIGFRAEDISFADYSAPAATVQLGTAASETLRDRLAQPQQGVVDAGLAALTAEAMEGGEAWTIFRDNASRDGAGSFSVGLAEMTSDRAGGRCVSLTMSALSFAGADSLDMFLSRSYSSTRIAIRYGPATVVIGDAIWNLPGIGSAIAQKVRPCERGYIANLAGDGARSV